jgi:hypothetical protein
MVGRMDIACSLLRQVCKCAWTKLMFKPNAYGFTSSAICSHSCVGDTCSTVCVLCRTSLYFNCEHSESKGAESTYWNYIPLQITPFKFYYWKRTGNIWYSGHRLYAQQSCHWVIKYIFTQMLKHRKTSTCLGPVSPSSGNNIAPILMLHTHNEHAENVVCNPVTI